MDETENPVDNGPPERDPRGRQAAWMQVPNPTIGEIIRKYKNDDGEMYHFMCYLGTNEKVKQDGFRVRKKDLKLMTEGATRWIEKSVHPMVPMVQPIETVPLHEGAPPPGPLPGRHRWEGYEFDKKTGVLDAGYFFYQVTLETPYHMARTSGEKEVKTITCTTIDGLRMNTSSTRQHVFDWARSVGIVEDLLVAAIQMALKGEEAKTRGSWDQVENVDLQYLEMMEEVELMDLQTRAMMKLIPQKYWPKMLKAPTGIEDVWSIGAYPKDRFKYIMLPSNVDRQLTQLAKYSLTIKRGIQPQMPPIGLKGEEFQRRTEVIDSSFVEDAEESEPGEEGSQSNKENRTPEADPEDLEQTKEESESEEDGSDSEEDDEVAIEQASQSTPTKSARTTLFQMVPRRRGNQGLQEIAEDPVERENRERSIAIDVDELHGRLERLRRVREATPATNNRNEGEENYFTPSGQTGESVRIPRASTQTENNTDPDAHLAAIPTTARREIYDIRESLRQSEEAATRLSEKWNQMAIEKQQPTRDPIDEQCRRMNESAEEYQRRALLEQQKLELISQQILREQEMIHRAASESKRQKDEEERQAREKAIREEAEREEAQRREKRQKDEEQRRRLVEEEREKERRSLERIEIKRKTEAHAQRMARETQELEKYIDDKLQELTIKDICNEEKEKELKRLERKRNEQRQRAGLLQSSYVLANYRVDHGETEEQLEEVLEYAITEERKYEITPEDVTRILRILRGDVNGNEVIQGTQGIPNQRPPPPMVTNPPALAPDNQWGRYPNPARYISSTVNPSKTTGNVPASSHQESIKVIKETARLPEDEETKRARENLKKAVQELEKTSMVRPSESKVEQEVRKKNRKSSSRSTISLMSRVSRRSEGEETDLEEVMSSVSRCSGFQKLRDPKTQKVMVMKRGDGTTRIVGRWLNRNDLEDLSEESTGYDTDLSGVTIGSQKVFVPHKLSDMAEKMRKQERKERPKQDGMAIGGIAAGGRRDPPDDPDSSDPDKKKKKNGKGGDDEFKDKKNRRRHSDDEDKMKKSKRPELPKDARNHARNAGQDINERNQDRRNYQSDQGNSKHRGGETRRENEDGLSPKKRKGSDDDSSSEEERKRRRIVEWWEKEKQIRKRKKKERDEIEEAERREKERLINEEIQRIKNEERDELVQQVRHLTAMVASMVVDRNEPKPEAAASVSSHRNPEGSVHAEGDHVEPTPENPAPEPEPVGEVEEVMSSDEEKKPEERRTNENRKRGYYSPERYRGKAKSYFGKPIRPWVNDKHDFGPRYLQSTIPDVDVAASSLKNAAKLKFAQAVDRYTKMPSISETALFDVIRQKLGKYATDTWFDPMYADLDRSQRPRSFLEAFKKQWIRMMDCDDYNKLVQGFRFDHLSDAVQAGVHFEQQFLPYLELADSEETKKAAERMKVARFRKILGGTLMAQMLNIHPAPFETVSEMIAAIKQLNDRLGITHRAQPAEPAFHVMALATADSENTPPEPPPNPVGKSERKLLGIEKGWTGWNAPQDKNENGQEGSGISETQKGNSNNGGAQTNNAGQFNGNNGKKPFNKKGNYTNGWQGNRQYQNNGYQNNQGANNGFQNQPGGGGSYAAPAQQQTIAGVTNPGMQQTNGQAGGIATSKPNESNVNQKYQGNFVSGGVQKNNGPAGNGNGGGSTKSGMSSNPGRDQSSQSSETREKKCFKCGNTTHLARECPLVEEIRAQRRAQRLCYKCRGKGHWGEECDQIHKGPNGEALPVLTPEQKWPIGNGHPNSGNQGN